MANQDRALSAATLNRIKDYLLEFGSALDAYDRGYSEAAKRIEGEADSAIRALLDSGELGETLLPRMRALVAQNQGLLYYWSELLDEVESARREVEPSTPHQEGINGS